jgi:hypothetical protein
MVLELPLAPDVEAALREQAAKLGIGVEAFVMEALAERLAIDATTPKLQARRAAWKDRLHACIALHPAAPQDVDDSRESIYSGRGE